MASPGCTICLDEFDDSNQVSALDCGHIYHFTCIKKWLRECTGKNQLAGCPTCNKTIHWFPAHGTAFKVFFHFFDENNEIKTRKQVADLEFQLASQENQFISEKSEASNRIVELEWQLASKENEFLKGNDYFSDSGSRLAVSAASN